MSGETLGVLGPRVQLAHLELQEKLGKKESQAQLEQMEYRVQKERKGRREKLEAKVPRAFLEHLVAMEILVSVDRLETLGPL